MQKEIYHIENGKTNNVINFCVKLIWFIWYKKTTKKMCLGALGLKWFNL